MEILKNLNQPATAEQAYLMLVAAGLIMALWALNQHLKSEKEEN